VSHFERLQAFVLFVVFHISSISHHFNRYNVRRFGCTGATIPTINTMARLMPVIEHISIRYDNAGDVDVFQAFTPLLSAASQLRRFHLSSSHSIDSAVDVSHVQWTLPLLATLLITHLPRIMLAPSLTKVNTKWCTPASLYHLLMNVPHITSLHINQCSRVNDLPAADIGPSVLPHDVKLTNLRLPQPPPCLVPIISACHQLTQLTCATSFPSWYVNHERTRSEFGKGL
jgi:hypothetical protein